MYQHHVRYKRIPRESLCKDSIKDYHNTLIFSLLRLGTSRILW